MKKTLELTYTVRHQVNEALQSTERLRGAPIIQQRPLAPHTVTHGYAVPTHQASTRTSDSSLPTSSAHRQDSAAELRSSSQPSRTGSQPPPTASSSTRHLATTPSTVSTLSLLTLDFSSSGLSLSSGSHSNSQDGPTAATSFMSRQHIRSIQAATSSLGAKPRRGRSCMKCGDSTSCPGRQTVELCKRPCRDCGNINCLGRDSKHPNKKCHQVSDERRQHMMLKRRNKKV